MSDNCRSEIEKTVGYAAESGETLFVALAAKAIAAQCGGSPALIAEELTRAGIRAGVTMQFGRPE
jgi:hypothetical protein